jgi:hypothetical protein
MQRLTLTVCMALAVAALEALSDELYQSCVQCHQHFRPGYGARPPR